MTLGQIKQNSYQPLKLYKRNSFK